MQSIYNLLGECFNSSTRYPVVSILNLNLHLYLRNAKLCSYTGKCYATLGNIGEADRYYRMSLTVKPGHIPAVIDYASLLRTQVNKRVVDFMICRWG